MDTKIASNVLQVIREERARLDAARSDNPDVAYDQELFHDGPFVNDLCLMLLVAVRHEVERALVTLACRVTGDGQMLTRAQYRQRLAAMRDTVRKVGVAKATAALLGLEVLPEWDSSMETLRLLANCHKHAPSQRPDDALLEHLGLDRNLNYAPLPESHCLRGGLARSLNLNEDADYCEIAEAFLNQTDSFLRRVQGQPQISEVEKGFVSFHPDDFEC